MSGLLCRIRSAGNGDLAFSPSRLTLAINADRDMRDRAGLADRQQLPLGADEPTASLITMRGRRQ